MFTKFLFIFILGILVGALSVRMSKNEEIAKLRIALSTGESLIRQTQNVMTAFIERNKEAGILECFTNSDLLNSLAKRNTPGIASVKTERFGPHIEILVPITNDHTAYVTMTDEAYEMLKGENDNVKLL